MADWTPIETAPKQHVVILYALTDTETGNYKMETGFWSEGHSAWVWEAHSPARSISRIARFSRRRRHFRPRMARMARTLDRSAGVQTGVQPEARRLARGARYGLGGGETAAGGSARMGGQKIGLSGTPPPAGR